jgi:hypothetical protein
MIQSEFKEVVVDVRLSLSNLRVSVFEVDEFVGFVWDFSNNSLLLSGMWLLVDEKIDEGLLQF